MIHLSVLGLHIGSAWKACPGLAALGPAEPQVPGSLLWTLGPWCPLCSCHQPCSGNVSCSVACPVSHLDGVGWDKWIFWSDSVCWKAAS